MYDIVDRKNEKKKNLNVLQKMGWFCKRSTWPYPQKRQAHLNGLNWPLFVFLLAKSLSINGR